MQITPKRSTEYKIEVLADINNSLDQLVAWNHLSPELAKELLLSISLVVFKYGEENETEEPEGKGGSVREGFSKLL